MAITIILALSGLIGLALWIGGWLWQRSEPYTMQSDEEWAYSLRKLERNLWRHDFDTEAEQTAFLNEMDQIRGRTPIDDLCTDAEFTAKLREQTLGKLGIGWRP